MPPDSSSSPATADTLPMLDSGIENRANEGLPTRWSDRWFDWRNRLLANPDFQRWARRNPFTRFMARRRARALFDLCSGFVYSQTLSACVQLGLFDLLQTGAMTSQAIARRIRLDQDATEMLLRSATALKLIENRGDERYGLGIHGAALLANPGVCTMIEHHTFLYRDLIEPVELLRREQPATMLSTFWDYAGARQQQCSAGDSSGLGSEPYTALMSASQAMIAEQIIDSYPVQSHQHLLDVGGGDGSFLRTVVRAAPDLALTLFDLPAVAARAEARFAESGLSNAVNCVGGNIFETDLPSDVDLVSLVRIVHDHDDRQALTILERCRAALRPGGTLLLAEPMALERVGDPATDAYFGFYLHAMGRGRPRTVAELEDLLMRAGFDRSREVRTHLPMLTRLLVARTR